MFEKIINIKNYGPFVNYNSGKGWDGCFTKNNIIYAPNGSGKTSISLIFESLKGRPQLIHKKKSLNSSDSTMLHLRYDGDNYKFEKGHWNREISQIAVFNSFYLEDNIYVIGNDRSIDSSINTSILFKETSKAKSLIFEEVRKYDKKLGHVNNERVRIAKEISKISSNKSGSKSDLKLLEEKSKELYKKKVKLLKQRKKVPSLLRSNSVKEISEKFVTSVNKYLMKFTPNIEFISIEPIYTSETRFKQANFEIKVNGQHVTQKDRTQSSLKYYLSEGDKNTVALAIFLAKFDLVEDVSDYVVIIDDPFTSFDTFRKTTTIREIGRLAEKVKQLIILTHDLHFAKDLSRELRNAKSLEIKPLPKDRTIVETNFDSMLLTGLMKDVETLHSLFTLEKVDQSDLLRIARSIRPSLEGMFRIKYFGEFQEKDWLGDMINRIRNSEEDSRFSRLKNYLGEIEDVNEYSKKFHHSSSQYIDETIDFQELYTFVSRTLKVLDFI